MPRFSPTTPDAVVDHVVDRIDTVDGRCVVAVDGADAADPVAFAQQVVTRLRADGRAADLVSLHDWVRPASLRLEYGHEDELSYRTLWFDYEALTREVITAVHTRDRWLPALWDERSDRSARARPRTAAQNQVVVVAGPMLLGRGLDLDVTVALTLTERTASRLTPEQLRWTVPALTAHAEHGERADVEVRMDHPDRPALLVER
ncbi:MULTISPECIES: hypothetical protein [Nocardiaceae]|uniref:Uridine kinase n=1 Tax=Rhodococcoides corynebacterioides TaxID=53972 RepID=A0ABS2KS15_9NOCA|nr:MULTISPECIES: hypothetical protein [Rhodococcus]MBM7414742.1 hypothetical protein [Rhodococcus corynebacterioides]MBP1117204.1 hypothetical protein [Rhodococcus sp. PvP016]